MEAFKLHGHEPGVSCLPTRTAMPSVASCVVIAVLALSACRGNDTPPPPKATNASPATAPPTERVVGPLTPEDAKALATMNDRIREYVDLHIKLERSLPKLPEDATPEQI